MFGVGRPDEQPSDDGSQGSEGPGGPGGKAGGMFGRSRRVVGVAVAAAAVALAGGAYALTSNSASAKTGHAQANQQAAGPIRLESITPAMGATQVDGASAITLTFSSPVAADSPDPPLRPAIAGSWADDGDELVFTPDTAFRPSSRVTVSVPAGLSGVRAADGGLLGKPVTDHFKTGGYSSLRLAEVLGQLGYLPLTWAPSENGAFKSQSASYDDANVTPQSLAYDPPAGTFTWKHGYPWYLHSLWSPEGSVVVRGAVMAFEAQHGMTIDGDVDTRFWNALFKAEQEGRTNPDGYSYAIASKAVPETLTIWHDGHRVFQSLANTGIPVSPTVDGTFPVYEKLVFQIMSGTNPDGSHYADPVKYVSYFNGGDAVHYFPRGSYGFQQSLGCVELPYTSAEQAYPYLTYGTLVTVAG